MKYNEGNKWYIWVGRLIFYPFYSWMGLMIIGMFLFPKSPFMDCLFKPLDILFYESTENWEGCWRGQINHRMVCFESTYSELSFKQHRNLELRDDIYSLEPWSGQKEYLYQITKRIECGERQFTPSWIMNLEIKQDSSGFYFQWLDEIGYLNRDGVGSISISNNDDTLFFHETELQVAVNIDSDTLNFKSSLTLSSFDELQWVSYKEGKFTKDSLCNDEIEFVKD